MGRADASMPLRYRKFNGPSWRPRVTMTSPSWDSSIAGIEHQIDHNASRRALPRTGGRSSASVVTVPGGLFR